MFYKFFDRKSSGGAVTRAWSETLATRDKSAIKNENMSNQQLAEELYRLITRKFEKCKEYTHLLKTRFGLLILRICN